MADAVVVDTWDGRGVRLTEVVKAMGELRHQSSDRGAIRTAVMTLVAIMPADDQAYAATTALRILGRHHPARIVLLRPDPDHVAALDARTALYAVAAQGFQVNFEEVTLFVGGQAANHLDSIVDAFTLSDLPVVVWYVGAVPDPADSLLSVATAVLIDSRDAAGSGQLRALLELARRRTVVDLSWIRLQPWRELVAGLMDPPEHRLWLDHVESVRVTGKIGPRQLLGGWLASRLHLAANQVQLTDARHVEIQILCRHGSEAATFEVVRGETRRTVSARAVLPSGVSPGGAVPLADDALATSLAEALTHLEPDVIWEASLSAATSLSA